MSTITRSAGLDGDPTVPSLIPTENVGTQVHRGEALVDCRLLLPASGNGSLHPLTSHSTHSFFPLDILLTISFAFSLVGSNSIDFR